MKTRKCISITTWALAAFLLVLRSGQAAENTEKLYERIQILGEDALYGVFDPSLEYNADGSLGWMLYSSLTGPPKKYTYGRFFNPKFIHTHLAQTLDNGKNWIYVTRINTSYEDKLSVKGYLLTGVWWHEVPTIVYDPKDSGKEWKMFWHRYFAIPEPYYRFPAPSNHTLMRVYEYMWIAYKYGATPEELSTSKEIVLFGAGPNPHKPYEAKYNLNTFHPSLKDMKAYSEPGSLYANGKIYLSLSAIPKENIKQSRLILLSSGDHGKTWSYSGTLLDHADAIRLGVKTFTGSSLVEENGRYFLFVSPVDFYGNHMGTFVLEFDDLNNGSNTTSCTVKDNVGNEIATPVERTFNADY